MNVIRTYSDNVGYLWFVFEDGSEVSYPAYLVYSPFFGADEDEKLQKLLEQAIETSVVCSSCKEEHMTPFPPNYLYTCLKCQAVKELDDYILSLINLI